MSAVENWTLFANIAAAAAENINKHRRSRSSALIGTHRSEDIMRALSVSALSRGIPKCRDGSSLRMMRALQFLSHVASFMIKRD